MKNTNLKQNLSTKLKSYIAATGSVVAATQLNGQIVYHDLSPDVILTDGDFFMLDLNNDNINDIEFSQLTLKPGYPFYYSSNSVSYVTGFTAYLGVLQSPNSDNHWATSSAGYGVFNFNNGTQVGPLASFNGYSNMGVLGGVFKSFSTSNSIITSSSSFIFPNFLGVEGFVGVKFKDNTNNYHYGWIRCEVSADGKTVTIKDYAYQAIVEYPIAAGATSGFVTSVEENMEKPVMINKINEVIQTKYSGKYTVEITTIEGKNIINQQAQNSFDFDCSSLTNGIYIIKTTTNEGIVFTKKIYI